MRSEEIAVFLLTPHSPLLTRSWSQEPKFLLDLPVAFIAPATRAGFVQFDGLLPGLAGLDRFFHSEVDVAEMVPVARVTDAVLAVRRA